MAGIVCQFSCAGLLFCFASASASAQRDLPSTELFMNALGTCAAGMRLNFSANIAGSVRSFYEGARTQGSARLENAPDFLILFPDTERMNAYRLYIDCITKIVGVPVNREVAPKREVCVSVWADCRTDAGRAGAAAIRSCQRYAECDPNNPWAHLLLGDQYIVNSEPTSAEIQFQRVLSIGQGTNDWATISRGYNGLARVQMARHQYVEAERSARSAVEAGSKSDDNNGMGMNYRLLGTIHQARNDPGSARIAFERAAPMFERGGSKFGLGTIHGLLGEMIAKSGDLQNGCAHLRKARVLFMENGSAPAMDHTDKKITQWRC